MFFLINLIKTAISHEPYKAFFETDNSPQKSSYLKDVDEFFDNRSLTKYRDRSTDRSLLETKKELIDKLKKAREYFLPSDFMIKGNFFIIKDKFLNIRAIKKVLKSYYKKRTHKINDLLDELILNLQLIEEREQIYEDLKDVLNVEFKIFKRESDFYIVHYPYFKYLDKNVINIDTLVGIVNHIQIFIGTYEIIADQICLKSTNNQDKDIKFYNVFILKNLLLLKKQLNVFVTEFTRIEINTAVYNKSIKEISHFLPSERYKCSLSFHTAEDCEFYNKFILDVEDDSAKLIWLNYSETILSIS